ncbi:hypothetical protein GCM10020366_70600 [Saccharopolyspora gregorii]|uniref:Acireductone synthase n=1 Tax=Saccharopolyspora gregorii TaxID=33914 RepID=A0ABP6S2X1_9PSEU
MTEPVAARWVVIDIEGTVTPTSQVREVLYDYARPRLGPWIDEHPDDPEVGAAVADVRAEAGLPADAGTDAVVAVLHAWMDADRKATPLKNPAGPHWVDADVAREVSPPSPAADCRRRCRWPTCCGCWTGRTAGTCADCGTGRCWNCCTPRELGSRRRWGWTSTT